MHCFKVRKRSRLAPKCLSLYSSRWALSRTCRRLGIVSVVARIRFWGRSAAMVKWTWMPSSTWLTCSLIYPKSYLKSRLALSRRTSFESWPRTTEKRPQRKKIQMMWLLQGSKETWSWFGRGLMNDSRISLRPTAFLIWTSTIEFLLMNFLKVWKR